MNIITKIKAFLYRPFVRKDGVKKSPKVVEDYDYWLGV